MAKLAVLSVSTTVSRLIYTSVALREKREVWKEREGDCTIHTGGKKHKPHGFINDLIVLAVIDLQRRAFSSAGTVKHGQSCWVAEYEPQPTHTQESVFTFFFFKFIIV